jgi:hypothetical protein
MIGCSGAAAAWRANSARAARRLIDHALIGNRLVGEPVSLPDLDGIEIQIAGS